MIRRLIALSLLLFSGAASLEAVTAPVRDGEVHHETTVEADGHRAPSSGEHGHEHDPSADEDGRGAPDADHGPDHRHGTSADHCTHVHSPALAGAHDRLAVEGPEGTVLDLALPAPAGPATPTLWHPPRI
ncbi:MAG: hypothetical protein RJQ04_07075 [Longimicrobiales bacterium]